MKKGEPIKGMQTGISLPVKRSNVTSGLLFRSPRPLFLDLFYKRLNDCLVHLKQNGGRTEKRFRLTAMSNKFCFQHSHRGRDTSVRG
jgi:hypothetical protein